MSTQQADPLRAAGVELTPDVIAKNRWYAFWDAPLFIPEPPAAGRGQPAAPTLGPPRTAAEIRRATATFNSSSCSVKTDGAQSRGDISRPVDGHVRRRPALHRVSRHEPDPDGRGRQHRGASGSRTSTMPGSADSRPSVTPRVTWRDTGGHDQQYAFGGVANETIVPAQGRESGPGRGREGRIDRGVSTAAHVLLHARSRHEPRLRLVPPG